MLTHGDGLGQERVHYTQDDHDTQIYVTEIFHPGDKRQGFPEAKDATKNELSGLFEQGVFRIIKKADIPSNAIILPSRMVQVIKNFGSKDEKHKAQIIVRGHKDRQNRFSFMTQWTYNTARLD